jgi:selenocysteine-specific elongation factor
VATIGGGVVLHPRPRKHKRPFESALQDLETLETGTVDEKISLLYQGAGKDGLRFSVIPALLGDTEKKLLPIYRDLLGKGILIRYDTDAEIAVAKETFDSLSDSIHTFLQGFHESNPTLEGVSAKEISAKVEYGIPAKLTNRLLAKLEKEKQIKRKGDIISLAGHQASLKGDMEKLGLELLAVISDGRYQPPTFKELADRAKGNQKMARQVLDLLANENRIVRISENLYFSAESIDELKTAVQNHLDTHGELDAQAFKDISGTSRKYAIPLLEYFDSIKLTLRVGDKRVARKSG